MGKNKLINKTTYNSYKTTYMLKYKQEVNGLQNEDIRFSSEFKRDNFPMA